MVILSVRCAVNAVRYLIVKNGNENDMPLSDRQLKVTKTIVR